MASESRIVEIARRLEAAFGAREARPTGDPLDELVGTILSQNTSDLNSGRAFAALKARYPTWTAVRSAPVEELADTIRTGGLANIKATRIQQALSAIVDDRGELDLEFLAAEPLDVARDWLSALPGVGRKTASCVLLFALGRPTMPVDTHVQRVARRLGIVPANASPEQIADRLESAVSASTVLRFHLDLINHGRQTCKAGRPRCEACPLADLCPRIGVDSRFGVAEERLVGVAVL